VSLGGRPDLAGDALRLVQAPTLLMVGGYDEPVIELNRDAMQQMRGHVELKIVPNATHLFAAPGRLEQVSDLAARWFTRYLPAQARLVQLNGNLGMPSQRIGRLAWIRLRPPDNRCGAPTSVSAGAVVRLERPVSSVSSRDSDYRVVVRLRSWNVGDRRCGPGESVSSQRHDLTVSTGHVDVRTR
jgi:hypothetical protein